MPADVNGNVGRQGPLWAWQRIDKWLRACVNAQGVSESSVRELREAIAAVNAETEEGHRI